jgi:hypothetical protein
MWKIKIPIAVALRGPGDLAKIEAKEVRRKPGLGHKDVGASQQQDSFHGVEIATGQGIEFALRPGSIRV